jgi:hypothetical protein
MARAPKDPVAEENARRANEHDLKSDYGLVSPTGVFWSCGFADHAVTRAKLDVDDNKKQIKGWIHVSGNSWDLYGRGEPTQAQLNTAMDWWQAEPEYRVMPKIRDGW